LILQRDEFLWPSGRETVTFRRPAPGTEARKIEHVPPEEIEAAVLWIIQASRRITREDALPEVRKALGYERAGDRIAAAIGAGIECLLSAGRIAERGGFLQVSR
jgi:hypothetical protein